MRKLKKLYKTGKQNEEVQVEMHGIRGSKHSDGSTDISEPDHSDDKRRNGATSSSAAESIDGDLY